MATLTLARLRKLLHYNPRTGHFTWLVARKNGAIPAGTRAGSYRHEYHVIKIDKKLYLASHLAFFYMTGHWPKQLVNHKNRNTKDNRWSNLREATKSQNCANQNRQLNKAGGLPKGVKYRFDKYWARITIDQKLIHLGGFLTVEEAHAAYMKAARELFGQFAYDGG